VLCVGEVLVTGWIVKLDDLACVEAEEGSAIPWMEVDKAIAPLVARRIQEVAEVGKTVVRLDMTEGEMGQIGVGTVELVGEAEDTVVHGSVMAWSGE